MFERVEAAAEAIRARRGTSAPAPQSAIVLGSGLGDFADTLSNAIAMQYEVLPHWPASRVVGHPGRLVIGADVVGMSTVPEVIVAVHAGMRVLGLSIITDMCLPDALHPVEISAILAAAAGAEPKLRKIVHGVLARERARK